MNALKSKLATYIVAHIQRFLALDLSIAHLMGAPQGFTLSAWAYALEQRGKPWGKVTRPVIDALMGWIMGQTEHCKQDFLRVTA